MPVWFLLQCDWLSWSCSDWAGFFLVLFLLGTVVHSVHLSPALGLVVLFCRVEVVVGVAAGLGEVAISKLKMGSSSSSKRCAVSMSQAGYLRVGFTFDAKLESVSSRTFSGVERRFWKWQ